MLTLYEKRIQMTGVLNLAVVQAATDQISNDSSQANRKDGGKILIRCHYLYTSNIQDGFRNAQLAAS